MSDESDDARYREEARLEAQEAAETETIEDLRAAILELLQDHGWTPDHILEEVAVLLRGEL